MGTVSGTARDQSGAVIPNAPVVMKNAETNVVSTTRTNEVGFYFFPTVPNGPYQISVEVPGMQPFQGSFTVQVGQSAVVDPVLQLGQTATQVEVRDVTPLVTVNSGTLGTNVERSRIEQLPINGRDLPNLLGSIPGYDGTGRMFGSLTDGTQWSINGVDVSERRGSNVPPINVALDSIQEFVVQSNAVSARMSRPVSIMVSTRNGTNALHGDLFETNRNNGVGLARSRTDFYTKPPQYNRNEFGGALGGPVVIPGVYNGKNKTFWFTSIEGKEIVQASTGIFTVPTPAMRNGDFSGLVDAQGRRYTIYDPWSTTANWSRTPYPGNVIPSNRESPLAKYMFSITPQATNNANPFIGSNWYGRQFNSNEYWQMNTRFDQNISERDQVHAVFTAAGWNQVFPAPAPVNMELPGLPWGWENDTDYLRSASATWTHIISPTFSNELTVTARSTYWTGGENDDGVNWPEKLGLPNPLQTSHAPQLTGLGLAGTYVYQSPDTKENRATIYTLDDNFVKIHGKHEFLFGFQGRREDLNILPQQRWPAPQLNFANNATALYDPLSTKSAPQVLPYTGNGLANFYLGSATYSANLSHNFYYLNDYVYAPYFQDNIKLTPRLTLNLGLRWEYQTPYHDKNGSMVGFNKAHDSVLLSAPLDKLYALGATYPNIVAAWQKLGIKFENTQQAGLPYDQIYSSHRDFGPRAGFAYRAFDGRSSFVIRGGYSISYFQLSLLNWIDNNRQNFPMAQGLQYNPNNTAQTNLNDGLGNYMARSVPTIIAGVNSAKILSVADATGITAGSGNMNYMDPNQPPVATHTWNLTLEKELVGNTVARVRYIGNHSAKLGQNYNYNPSTPAFIWYMTTGTPLPTGATANIATRPYDSTTGMGNIQAWMRTGRANTNGVEAEVERRFSRGIAFQLSYTMMNAFDNVNAGSANSAGTMSALNQYLPGLVPADYNARNELLNYSRDTSIPKHQVKWNWLIDLPFGRGKKIGGNAGKLLDKFIGGWQLAGMGRLWSTYFSLPTGNWNFTGVPLEAYGYKYPIQNCTSGNCLPGYLWTNAGYISPAVINRTNSAGQCTGICGIPSNYKPAQTPLIPYGGATLPANAPEGTNVSQYWETNNMWIPLNNGTVVRTAYDSGWNPWDNQYMPGPRERALDASLFKQVSITERFRLRFNADFFNVLNHPGNPNSVGANGILNTQGSAQGPRTLQLTLRLAW